MPAASKRRTPKRVALKKHDSVRAEPLALKRAVFLFVAAALAALTVLTFSADLRKLVFDTVNQSAAESAGPPLQAASPLATR